jgi:glycosyltransferase involved in cell wall biosynthesis
MSAKITPVKISATIIAFNEEENIADALRSLRWADEIIVVDSESTDRTVAIAEKFGARVFVQKWLGFGRQKQFAAEKCAHPWIFSLDADERVSEELENEILTLKNNPEEKLCDGYLIPRLTFYMNRPIRHSGWYPDRKLRLYRKNRGVWKELLVHETIRMETDAKIGRIDADILHFSVRDAAQHHKMIGERYAPLSAEEMFKNGRTTSPLKIATVGFTTFLKSYILKGGFRDGLPGFCISRFAAHHAFLKHLLLWEMINKKDSEAEPTDDF